MQCLILSLDTALTELEDCLKKFIRRDDIDIILINQNVSENSLVAKLNSALDLETLICILFQIADMIRHTIDQHTAPVPAILEIPSKDHPYDPSKDSILR